MKKEILFAGDELELLNALDRTGCVLTDDGKFYCDSENRKLQLNSRLPIRIRGTYAAGDGGWKIVYSIAPAPRTLAIGVFCVIALAAFLISGASYTGTAFFGILCGAMVINYLAQKKSCLRRFESTLLHKPEFEW